MPVGHWFTLTGDPELDMKPADHRQFVVTSVRHDIWNNLPKILAGRVNGYSRQAVTWRKSFRRHRPMHRNERTRAMRTVSRACDAACRSSLPTIRESMCRRFTCSPARSSAHKARKCFAMRPAACACRFTATTRSITPTHKAPERPAGRRQCADSRRRKPGETFRRAFPASGRDGGFAGQPVGRSGPSGDHRDFEQRCEPARDLQRYRFATRQPLPVRDQDQKSRAIGTTSFAWTIRRRKSRRSWRANMRTPN